MKTYIILLLIGLTGIHCRTKNTEANEKTLMLKADSFKTINQLDSAYSIWDQLKISDNINIALEANIKIGQLYILTNEYNYALNYFLNVYESKQIDSLTEKIGLCYYKLNKLDSAILFFNKSINYYKKNSLSYCYLGICYEELNNIDSAIVYYNLAIKKHQIEYLAFNNLGGIYLDKDVYDSAIYMYQKAIELNPSFSAPYYNLSVCYMDLSQYKNGLEMINNAIKLTPNNSMYLFNKAEIYTYLNEQDSVCLYLRRSSNLGYKKALDLLKYNCK
jgi:tetratricopeptide (TPR) repeat protein